MIGEPGLVMIVLAALGGGCLLLWPLIRALARRLEAGAAGGELRGELATLEERVHNLERERTRVAELEERLDFAERLLAQNREPDRLQR